MPVRIFESEVVCPRYVESLRSLLRSTVGFVGVMVDTLLEEDVMEILPMATVKERTEIVDGAEPGKAFVVKTMLTVPFLPPPPMTVPALGPLQEDIAKMARMNRGRKQTGLKRIIRNPTIA